MNEEFKWRLWYLNEMNNVKEMIFGGKMYYEIENDILLLIAPDPDNKHEAIVKYVFPAGRWLMIEKIENEEEEETK